VFMNFKKELKPSINKDVSFSDFSVFDIETINWVEPYAVGYYEKGKYNLYEGKNCITEFINNFLTFKNRNKVCYAHNGGKFDFSFILKELFEKKFSEKFYITPLRIGSRIAEIKIYRMAMCNKGKNAGKLVKKDKFVLRDSFALLGFSLEKLCKNFDVEHKKGELDYEKINWKNYQDFKSEWSPYLKNDCIGLYEVLKKFEERNLKLFGTNLKKSLTIAQHSMNVFKSKFLKNKIPCYEGLEDDIRMSYFGGRTEIFKMRGENLNYYDVNSLYPSVMFKNSFPVGTPTETNYFNKNDLGIAFCDIEMQDYLEYPLLPYRNEAKKLIFPLGSWKGWYTTPEIRKARELGYNITILKGYVFEKQNLFKDYISKLYEIKKNSDSGSVDYLTSKLLMNSLYGKFGQRREKQQYYINPVDKIGLEPLDIFEDIPVYTKKVESQATHILPAISSFVTSYARLELYKLFEEVQRKGKSVFYCDTDSVVTNALLHTGKELGELKLEKEIDKGYFILPKMYALKCGDEEEVKAKGFPRKLFSFKQFEKAVLSDDYSALKYNKKIFASPFESMRRNKTMVSMIDFKRSVITRYDKRKVLQDGETTPLYIS